LLLIPERRAHEQSAKDIKASLGVPIAENLMDDKVVAVQMLEAIHRYDPHGIAFVVEAPATGDGLASNTATTSAAASKIDAFAYVV
jgi:hypothetical protein